MNPGHYLTSVYVVLQPSLTGNSRIVTHDIPVGVVPRRLWIDLAEPEMPDFDVGHSSVYLVVECNISSLS